MSADVVLVALWVVGLGPYFLARVYHAEWYWQVAAGLLGLLAFSALAWALARARWFGETYRLAKGHADLAFDTRLRSRVANALAFVMFLPAVAASVFLLLVGHSAASPFAKMLLVIGLAFLLMAAARLAVYAGVRVAERMDAKQRKQKREARRKNK